MRRKEPKAIESVITLCLSRIIGIIGDSAPKNRVLGFVVAHHDPKNYMLRDCAGQR